MPDIVNRPDLSLTDLIERAQSLATRLSRQLDPFTCLEMQSGLQLVLRIENDGGKRIGLCAWIATWKPEYKR